MTQPGTAAMSPLRVGMVGAGLISAYHLDALASLDDVEVTVLVARDVARAQSVADNWNIAYVVGDWRQLGGHVDAAIIATPDDTHVEIAQGLMEQGIAVLVQKPIATSVDDADALVAASPTGLLSASFMHRYLDATVALAGVLERGELGQVMSVRLRNATPGPDWGSWFFAPGGPTAGVISQLGVHGIDLIEHLFGSIVEVQAMSSIGMPQRVMKDGSVVSTTVPDHVNANYRLASGALVSHEQCWAEAGGTERFRLEVHGTRASATIEAPSKPVIVHERGTDPRLAPLDLEPVLGHRHHAAWVRSVRECANDGTALAAARGLRIAEAVASAAASATTVSLASYPSSEEITR